MYLKRTKFAHYIHKETEIYFGWTGGAKKKKRHNSRLKNKPNSLWPLTLRNYIFHS